MPAQEVEVEFREYTRSYGVGCRGGVIGLAIAWRAARDGWAVRLYDPSIGSGASWVAGGMLAPLSEGWPGEETALTIGAASLERWPTFGEELGNSGNRSSPRTAR